MLRKTALVAVSCALLSPAAMLARKQPPLPAGQQQAGVISAILRNATLLRGSGADPKADYGTQIVWSDTVRTDGNGRVRIKLADDSTLSMGSNSEVIFSGRQEQTTSLTLNYGRMRVRPTSNQVFEVRTPSAVVSASGSDFAIDASLPGRVKLICLDGPVRITSLDSTSECDAGEMITVMDGKAPYQPQFADATTLGIARNITDPEEQQPVTYFP